jgi:DNA-binding MarR family transcriptional regulator
MQDTKKLIALVTEWSKSCTTRSMNGMTRYVKGVGLSMPQFGLLMRLYHHGKSEVSGIGRQFGVTSAAASQLVDRLAQAGYVRRTEDDADRRVRQVSLTDNGRAVIERGFRKGMEWVPGLVEALGAEGRRSISEMLPPLIAAAKKLPRLQ